MELAVWRVLNRNQNPERPQLLLQTIRQGNFKFPNPKFKDRRVYGKAVSFAFSLLYQSITC
jgi:hypothetical protein